MNRFESLIILYIKKYVLYDRKAILDITQMTVNHDLEKDYQFRRNTLEKSYQDRQLYLQEFHSENVLSRGFLNLRYAQNGLWEDYLKQKDLDQYALGSLDLQRAIFLNELDSLINFCWHEPSDLKYFLYDHNPMQQTKLLFVAYRTEESDNTPTVGFEPYILLCRFEHKNKKILYQIANLSTLEEEACLQALNEVFDSNSAYVDYTRELVHFESYDHIDQPWRLNYIALKNTLWIAQELEMIRINESLIPFMQSDDVHCTDALKFHLLKHLVAHESELWPEINLNLLEKTTYSPRVYKAALGNF